MGIKNIHIGFIVVSILTAVLCGCWLFATESGRSIANSTALGAAMFASVPLMLFYGVRFVQKAQREGLE